MTSNALLLDDGIIKMNHFTIRMMRVLSLWIWWIIPTISFSFQPAQSKTRSRRYHCLESTITDDDTIQQIQQSQLQLQSQSQSTTDTTTNIVFPNSSFRKTLDHEVSVASFNMLAPFYNSLALLDWEAREPFAEQDRTNRVPLAIQMAKQTNADVLCLQEVEGLQHESRLKQLLMEPHKDMDGYDSLLWAPLMPKREGDIVGLCVAWRSKKHTLLASNCFSRGMIVQLQEISTGATFGIGNVHLPAKPSNVLGRLKTMSNTIQKLACYDPPRRKSPLDGLLLIAGDFNCDAYSVTGRLLSTGKSSYGNLHDRNYKANLSKASASQMRHHYRFQNIYDGPINNDNNSNNKNLQTLRETYAPVTVSLHGRGPGCMDQLYFTQFPTAPKRRNNNNDPDSINTILSPSRKSMGKRKKRRDKASRTRSQERNLQNYRSNGFVATNVRVDSVLATIAGPHDTQRLQVINDGLPNVQEGFPSDHIPIGGLFVGNRDTNGTYSTRDGDETLSSSSTAAAAAAGYNEKEMGNHKDQSPVPGSRSLGSGGGVKASVRKRRQTHQESVLIRRRHNLVLQCVADWLEGRGATKIIRDQPLYKNLFLLEKLGDKSLTKKSRAPDLVCCLGNINGADGDDDGFVAVLEVTVSAKPENARAQKLDKYQDLCQRLPKLPLENKDALFVIVVEEHGTIPEETRRDLETLAALSTNDEEDAKKEAQRFCNYLQAMITAT